MTTTPPHPSEQPQWPPAEARYTDELAGPSVFDTDHRPSGRQSRRRAARRFTLGAA
ncbi:hypothetical protein ABT144_32845 [Streptomyces sp. NPDC002039]|uniref:hypothetical protein n=1 Tax=Streptomyces sp. NPDC002039 TaxID=3154660 RepID=UPI00331C5D91